MATSLEWLAWFCIASTALIFRTYDAQLIERYAQEREIVIKTIDGFQGTHGTCSGNLMAFYGVITEEKCAEHCYINPRCKAFTYANGNHAYAGCYLKENCSNIQTADSNVATYTITTEVCNTTYACPTITPVCLRDKAGLKGVKCMKCPFGFTYRFVYNDTLNTCSQVTLHEKDILLCPKEQRTFKCGRTADELTLNKVEISNVNSPCAGGTAGTTVCTVKTGNDTEVAAIRRQCIKKNECANIRMYKSYGPCKASPNRYIHVTYECKPAVVDSSTREVAGDDDMINNFLNSFAGGSLGGDTAAADNDIDQSESASGNVSSSDAPPAEGAGKREMHTVKKREADVCASNPCMHGSKCMMKTDSWYCVCQPDWAGATCSVRANQGTIDGDGALALYNQSAGFHCGSSKTYDDVKITALSGSVTECATLCSRQFACNLFVYNQGNASCELLHSCQLQTTSDTDMIVYSWTETVSWKSGNTVQEFGTLLDFNKRLGYCRHALGLSRVEWLAQKSVMDCAKYCRLQTECDFFTYIDLPHANHGCYVLFSQNTSNVNAQLACKLTESRKYISTYFATS